MKLNIVRQKIWITLISFTLLCLFSLDVYAQKFTGGGCSMQTYPPANFFISYEHQTTGMFGPNVNEFPPVTIENCRGAHGQHLAFGLALRKPSLASDVNDVSYDGILKEDLCKIENAPIEMASADERNKIFSEQFKLLRSCTSIEVTHLEQKQLNFNPNQKFCKITRKASYKVEAKGDLCFLPITSDTRLALSVVINPDCAKEEYLRKNNIQISDIEALLTSYIVPDDTGEDINNQLGSQKIRLAALPSSEIMPVFEGVSEGGPRFPTEYSPDVHLAQIKIKDDSQGNDERTFIEMKVFVDNKADRRCFDGFCVSPNDYQAPLAAEVELFEIVNGRKKHVDAWYTGNVYDPFVKAQWQGLYSFGRRIIDNYKMEKGKQYEIALNFYNPYDDYLLLTNTFDQLLVDLTHLNGTAGLDALRPVSPIVSIHQMPTINSLPPIGIVEDINKEFERVRQYFKKLGSEIQFPPVYDYLCHNSKCTKSNKRNYFLKLSTSFILGEVDENDLSFKMENAVVKKDSHVYESYSKQLAGYPELKCTY